MKRIVPVGILLGLGLALVLGPPTVARADSGKFWVHVKVQEHEGDQEVVRVNLPITTVEAVLPAIESKGLSHGKVTFEHGEIDGVDLRKLLTAVRDSEEGEYVTVESKDESVRVAKEKEQLVVHVIDRNEDEDEREEVWIRMPMTVVEALLSSDSDELDIAAALRALGEHGGGELVSVEGTDAHVRIWVDQKNSSD